MGETADVHRICKGYLDRNTIKTRMGADALALDSKGGVLDSTVLRTHYNVDDDGEVRGSVLRRLYDSL